MTTQNTTQWILDLKDKVSAPMNTVIQTCEKAQQAFNQVSQSIEDCKKKAEALASVNLSSLRISTAVTSMEIKFLGLCFEKTGQAAQFYSQQMEKAKTATAGFGQSFFQLVGNFQKVVTLINDTCKAYQNLKKIFGGKINTGNVQKSIQKMIQDILKALKKLPQEILKELTKGGKNMPKAFAKPLKELQKIPTKIITFFKKIPKGITGTLKSIPKQISTIFNRMVRLISGAVGKIPKNVANNFKKILTTAQNLFKNIGKKTKIFQTLFNSLFKGMSKVSNGALKSIINIGAKIFSKGMDTACKSVSKSIASIPIVGWIALIIQWIIQLVSYFWNTSATFRGILYGIWGAIKAVFTGIGTFISTVLSTVWDLIKKVFNPVHWFDGSIDLSGAMSKIGQAAMQLGSSVKKGFEEGKAEGIKSFNDEKGIGKKQGSPGAPNAGPQANAPTGKGRKGKSRNPAANYDEAGADGYADNEEDDDALVGGTQKATTSARLNQKDLAAKKQQQTTATTAATQYNKGKSKAPAKSRVQMNINITNNFSVTGTTDIKTIAEKIVKGINDKLRDSVVAYG